MGDRLVRLPAHLAPARPARLDRLAVACSAASPSSPCGLIGGEVGDVHFAEFSGRSIFGLLYLITFGSLLAFTSYAWLLQNAPISKVSTYAYVNPVVAIALGWLILDEGITATTLIGAGSSSPVALVVARVRLRLSRRATLVAGVARAVPVPMAPGWSRGGRRVTGGAGASAESRSASRT